MTDTSYEKNFAEVAGSHSWVVEQALAFVVLFLELNCRTLPCAPSAMDARVVANDTTVKDIENGRVPRYCIWFRNEHGQTELVTTAEGVFLFTPNEKMAKGVFRAYSKIYDYAIDALTQEVNS